MHFADTARVRLPDNTAMSTNRFWAAATTGRQLLLLVVLQLLVQPLLGTYTTDDEAVSIT